LFLVLAVIAALTSVIYPELAILGFLGFLSFFDIGAPIIVRSSIIQASNRGLMLLEKTRDSQNISELASRGLQLLRTNR
jgi:hypothetical protein